MTNAAESVTHRALRDTLTRVLLRNAPFVFAAGILTALCFGKVQTEFDKATDFSRYKTYEWLAPRVLKKTGLVENDPAFSPVVKAAMNRELARRGMSEVTSGGQLQITTMALTESVPSVDALIFPGQGVYGSVGGVMTTPNANVATVGRYNKKGTLAIGLIDTSTKKTVWMAMATNSYGKQEQLAGKVNKAVTEMFEKFPVKPTS